MMTGSEARPRTVLNIVRAVRRRWRLRLLLRGGAIVGAGALVTLVAASWLLERAGFSAGALLVVRLASYAALVALAVQYLLRPLARRVSDERAALYLEEHDPEIHELLVTAVGLERSAPLEPMARRTVERALQACARLDDGRAIERRNLRRAGGMLAAVAVVTLLLTALRPAGLGHGAQALLHPLRGAAASSPYAIQVEPGDATIPRGADQRIRAQLSGFQAGDVALVMRSGADSSFQHISMTATGGAFEASMLAVSENTEYFVEAGGVRSAVFRIRVADLPYVKAMSLDYHYPAYTGLPPEHVEPAGDVAALRGTRVQVSATTTLPAAGGAIVLSSGARFELRRDSAGWTGAFPVEQRGFYHLELRTSAGQVVTGSPEYAIDILPDRAPAVRFSKPGRDTRPTAVDEVFLEASAEDDYGVRSVELLYSVNGGAEQSVTLFQSPTGLKDVAAGRTLYLEEMGLKPGDVVSYYARARDGSPGGKPASSDIYFLTIRPFGRDYRQADSGPQQGGGQQGGENAGELTQQQREIVAATFNLLRDSAGYTASAFREYANTIALMQDRLRQQVLTLAQRMRNRQVTADSTFAQIAAILPRAAVVMDTVLAQLRGRGARPALGPEQRALQQLERAEALFRDVQVQLQRQAAGGGGGASPNASDLADLFELELDKLRNQYETVQRGQREQASQQVDEAAAKLRELAQRLQQENERLRRQAMQTQGQAAGGGGGDPGRQRELAQQLEQAARQLERLSREQPREPGLERAARDLERAADALRRAAAEARAGRSANAEEALARLRDANRRLQDRRASATEREARDALRQAEELAQRQRETGERVEGAARAGRLGADPSTRELIDRRSRELTQTGDLEQELDRLANASRRDQQDASRRLQEAAEAIRQGNLKEMQAFSRNLMRDGASAPAVGQLEQRIRQAMDSVLGDVRRAAEAFRPGEEGRRAEGLDRARDLVRGLESMRERSRAAAEGRQAGAQAGAAPARPGEAQGAAGRQPGQGRGAEGQQPGQARSGEGQPGQGRAGARATGREGGGGPATPGTPAGVVGGVVPGLSADQARQLRGEIRERLADAEALRRELRAQGRDVGQLDDVLRGMRRLEGAGAYGNAAELLRLQGAVVESAQAFEFELRRALLGEEREKLYLSGAAEVPPAFRKAVADYFRSLSQGR